MTQVAGLRPNAPVRCILPDVQVTVVSTKGFGKGASALWRRNSPVGLADPWSLSHPFRRLSGPLPFAPQLALHPAHVEQLLDPADRKGEGILAPELGHLLPTFGPSIRQERIGPSTSCVTSGRSFLDCCRSRPPDDASF